MRNAFFMVFCVLSFAELRAAELSTIEFYLAKSPLVIVATAEETPGGMRSASLDYGARVEVDEVLHGSLVKKNIIVSIYLPLYPLSPIDQRVQGPKKGQKYILFLKAKPEPNVGWGTSDPWFGFQLYNRQFASAIEQTSKSLIEAARWKPFKQFKHGVTPADFSLLSTLAAGNDKDVAMEALSQLSRLKPNEELNKLLNELMLDDDRELALQAAITSCYSGDWSGFDHLLDCVEHADIEIRKQAVSQLASDRFIRHTGRVVPALFELLAKEEDARVLAHAIASLETYPSTDVLDKVKEFLNHDDELVSTRAARVVYMISSHIKAHSP